MIKKNTPTSYFTNSRIFTALFEYAVLIRCHHNEHSFNPQSATNNLQQTTITSFAAFTKNIISYLFRKLRKMSQNVSTAAVVIGALRVNFSMLGDIAYSFGVYILFFLINNSLR